MSKTIKRFLLICLLVTTVLVISGCASKSVYDTFDEDGYNISIRFDAGDGTLMDKVSSIVDSYNISGMKTNAEGEVEIALLDPTDDRRGNVNKCQPQYPESGYYLAGWYAERTTNPDGSYTYSKPWDFEKDRVRVSAKGEHSASEPVMTLYAKWMPLLSVEVYDRATNELLEKIPFDPNLDKIQMPEWKSSSAKGTIDMNDMPEKEGYTFDCAYYDLEGTMSVPFGQVLNFEDAPNVADNTIKVYLDWLEGEWYHIYDAKQFTRAADESGNYIIYADLDFGGLEWPRVFLTTEFSGSIQTADNAQFKFSNIIFSDIGDQTGLFQSVGKDAAISNVAFENVTFNLKNGGLNVCRYGLFAGTISSDAKIQGVTITNSQILISEDIIPNDNYSVGLVSAEGNWSVIDCSGISCTIVEGKNPKWNFNMEVDGNTVLIERIN